MEELTNWSAKDLATLVESEREFHVVQLVAAASFGHFDCIGEHFASFGSAVQPPSLKYSRDFLCLNTRLMAGPFPFLLSFLAAMVSNSVSFH